VKDALPSLSTFGIGSVPYVKGEKACEKIFQRFDIPFWPQYPARSPRENFVFQFLSSFPGLEVSGQSVSFNEKVYESQAGNHRERLAEAFLKKSFLDFEPPVDWAVGYSQFKASLEEKRGLERKTVKLQVTGLGTVWRSFFSEWVSSGKRGQVLLDLCDTLVTSGLAQIQMIQSYGRIPFMMIDEPLLGEQTRFGLERMIRFFKEAGALVGLHVCSDVQWGSLEGLKLDVFHFDLSRLHTFPTERADVLKTVLRRGGRIAWGVIPTGLKLDLKVQDFSSILLNWWEEIFRENTSFKEIKERSLLAPACGTGTLDPLEDEVVWRSLKLTKKSLDSKKWEGILHD